MPPADSDAEIERAERLAREHGLHWSEQQCRLLLKAVLEYRRELPAPPQDVAWAEVIDYVPSEDCAACEQLVLLLYPPGSEPPESTFRNAWWDSLDVEDANRTACPTFTKVPAEHVSEVARLRMGSNKERG